MTREVRRYVGRLSTGKRVYVRSDNPNRLVFAVFANERNRPGELRLVDKIAGCEVRAMTCQNGLDHLSTDGCCWAWPGGGDRSTQDGQKIGAGEHAAWRAHWWRCVGKVEAEVVELQLVKKRGVS